MMRKYTRIKAEESRVMRVLFLSESVIPEKITSKTLSLGEIRVIAAQQTVSQVVVLGPQGTCFYDLPSKAKQTFLEKKIILIHFTWFTHLVGYYLTWIPLFWHAFWFCRRNSIDLIQAESPHVSGVAAVLLKWFFHLPICIEYRVSYAEVAQSRYGNSVGRFLSSGFHFLTRFVVSQTDLVLANCESAQRDFIRQYPGTKRICHYNAGVRVPKSLFLKKNTSFQVGFLGRLYADKGVTYFLRAILMQATWFRSHQVHFFVGGDGPQKTLVEAFIKTNQLNDLVTLEGTVDRWDFLSRMDVIVNTTIVRAALEMAIAESQSLGIPVIAFGEPGFPETVHDDVSGFLVPVGDVKTLSQIIQRVISDKSLYRSMRGKARKHGSTYAFDRQVELLSAAYTPFLVKR